MDARLKELRREFDALARILKGTIDLRQRDGLTQQICRVIQEVRQPTISKRQPLQVFKKERQAKTLIGWEYRGGGMFER